VEQAEGMKRLGKATPVGKILFQIVYGTIHPVVVETTT
jgi:hypothetical protein